MRQRTRSAWPIGASWTCCCTPAPRGPRNTPRTKRQPISTLYAPDTTTRTVDSHIFALRRKLEPVPEHPRYIVTQRGAGYLFDAAVEAARARLPYAVEEFAGKRSAEPGCNVVIRTGPASGKAILLSAHYDAVVLPDGTRHVAQVDGGSGHSGKREPVLYFGLGAADPSQPLPVEIQWRDTTGRAQRRTFHFTPGRHTVQLGGIEEGA